MTGTCYRVVGIGEVLWDLLPDGKQLGGAPANFAGHAHALGARAAMVSSVGNDPLGREILDRLAAQGLPIDCVTVDPHAPTGTVSVTLSADGTPSFVIHENVAWDRLAWTPGASEVVGQADAVCFGTLAQRSEQSRETIRALLEHALPTCLRVFDINLRQQYYSAEVIEYSLRAAHVLKINDDEMPVLAKMLDLAGDVRDQVADVAQQYELLAVALTRGGRGSLLYRDGQWADHPGIPAQVVDTVGAGDSFTAAMTLGLLAGWELDMISLRANELAAYVCSQSGATPRLPEPLVSPFVAI
jgi:fructokinase